MSNNKLNLNKYNKLIVDFFKLYKIYIIGVICFLLGSILGDMLNYDSISQSEYGKVVVSLEETQIQLGESQNTIKELESKNERLQLQIDRAKPYLDLNYDARQKVDAKIEEVNTEQEEKAAKKALEKAKQEALENAKKEESQSFTYNHSSESNASSISNSQSSSSNSNNNSSSSNEHIGKSVYIANGNSYYHAISNCKYLEGAKTSLVTLTSDMRKFECNCWTNPVIYKPSSSSSSSSSGSSSSGGRTVYIASGNSYYHSSSSCKFLRGASVTAVGINNVGGKQACNCIKYYL